MSDLARKRKFVTQCSNPLQEGKAWGGPDIIADSFESAEMQVLEIRSWLTNMGLPSTELRVEGELVMEIEVEEDSELASMIDEIIQEGG